MIKTYFFIVILGETDALKFTEEEKRLNSLGEVQKLAERTYGLVIKGETAPKPQELREKISGDNNFLCLVIRILATTKCSWCLYKSNSTYLTGIFETLYKETEAKDEQ